MKNNLQSSFHKNPNQKVYNTKSNPGLTYLYMAGPFYESAIKKLGTNDLHSPDFLPFSPNVAHDI